MASRPTAALRSTPSTASTRWFASRTRCPTRRRPCVVTAGTAMYGLTELGGLVAGESVVVTGPGPIGLLGVAVAKALGAQPVILTGTRDNRLQIGLELGADHVVNAKQRRPGRCGSQAQRRQGRRLRRRMFGCTGSRQRGRAYGQPWRPHLSRRIPKQAGRSRYRLSRAQQHLRLWHPRRRQERHASRRGVHRRRNGSTPPRCILTLSHWKTCRPHCDMPASASRMPSRSSSRPMATRRSRAWPLNDPASLTMRRPRLRPAHRAPHALRYPG